MDSALPYKIRSFRRADESFVYSSWLHSFEPYRDPKLSRDAYYLYQHRLISHLMTAEAAQRLVAVSPDDSAQIFGWLFGVHLVEVGGPVLDYAFVKPIYRRLAVARGLMAQWLGSDAEKVRAYTHWTPLAEPILNAPYLPYLLQPPYRR